MACTVEGTPVRRQFFGQERTRNPSVLQIDIKPKRILFDFAAHSIPDKGEGSREFAFDRRSESRDDVLRLPRILTNPTIVSL